jgi:predicted dehydrogenase
MIPDLSPAMTSSGAAAEGPKLHLGIIGCADIAKKICAAIKVSSNVKLVALASRTREKVEKFALENDLDVNTTQLYDNYDALLQDPNVHAVYIPLPTLFHLEWVLKTAQVKKHIIIEKPVAVHAEDFVKMLKACQDNQIFMMDGTMFVHHPRTHLLRQALFDPSNGPMHRVQTCLTFPADENFFQNNIRTKADADPLGAIGDLGWYCARIGLLAFSYKAISSHLNNKERSESNENIDETYIRYPVSAQAICTRWTHDGVSHLSLFLLPLLLNHYLYIRYHWSSTPMSGSQKTRLTS